MERPEQLPFLRDREYDILRGYLFTRPLPEAQPTLFLTEPDKAQGELVFC